jgi:hypothetical protein
MTWVMDDKEFEAVLSLLAQRRYAFCSREWLTGNESGP